MTRHFFTCMSVLCVLALPSDARAQQTEIINPDRNQPLEITADATLEWKRDDKIFIATKNAVATQGEASVAAEILTANYREGNGSDFEIWRVTAARNVVITSRDSKAYGTQATYNIDKGLAVMTGDDLRMVSADQTVTARDSFEYWVAEGRLVAIGNAVVTRPKPAGGVDTLSADTITAYMVENAEGKRVLDRLEAQGNVIITTPAETITGNYGEYRAADNKAEIRGAVELRRGPNRLQGNRAEIDLLTNISRLFGAGGENGRVRGVFFPGSNAE